MLICQLRKLFNKKKNLKINIFMNKNKIYKHFKLIHVGITQLAIIYFHRLLSVRRVLFVNEKKITL